MYFEQHGNGQPVVFLHGWGCDGSIFLSVVERLPNYANYLVDFNGFGKSNPPPESGWAVADFVEQLVDFLQEHNLSNVTVVGHSFGCRVALVLAANHPELVCRMLLVAPAGLRRFSLSRWWKVTKYKLSKFFAKRRGVAVTAKYASEDYLNCSAAMRNTFVKVINEDLSSYAKRVACPVLIVNGREDSATPLSHAKRLHKLIKHSSLVEIDGDHFAFFRNSKAFADTIKNFVE